MRLRRAREFVGPEIMAQAPGWQERAAAMNARYPAPTAEDAAWADALIFGTPTRFGNVSAELKAYIDSLGGFWFQGKLNGKAGAVFCSTSAQHGGNETTLLSMYVPLAHLGLIIVPTGYADPGHVQGRHALWRDLDFAQSGQAAERRGSRCRALAGAPRRSGRPRA